MAIKINGTNTTASPGITGPDTDTGLVYGTDEVQVVTGGTTRATVDSSGRVGIGTAAPGLPLDIVSNASSETVRFRGASGGVGTLRFTSNDAGTNYAFIQSRSTFFDIGSATSIPLLFTTNNTEAARLDSSGRLLVGTTTEGLAGSADKLTLANSGDTGITIRSGSSNYGNIMFSDATSGTGEYAGYVQYYHNDNCLKFGTASTERMRLTSGGSLLLASRTSDDFAGAGTLFQDSSGGTSPVYLYFKKTFSGTRDAIDFRHSGTQVGSITFSNSNTAYNTSSDYRLKENIVDLTGAIARVNQLSPRRFNFIGESDTVDGFVAHEAQAVVPEAVHGTHNGVEVWDSDDDLPDGVSVGDSKLDENKNTIPKYQGIDQSKLVPLLTAALQEAIAKIETLETKVAALEAG